MDETTIKRGALAMLVGLFAWIARWIVLIALILLLLLAGLVVTLAMRKDRVAVASARPRLVPRISG